LPPKGPKGVGKFKGSDALGLYGSRLPIFFGKNILPVRFFRFIDISVLQVINNLIHTFPFSCGLFAAESVSGGKQVAPLESQEIFGGNVQFRA